MESLEEVFHSTFITTILLNNYLISEQAPMGKVRAKECASHCGRVEILRKFGHDFSTFFKILDRNISRKYPVKWVRSDRFQPGRNLKIQ